ncbi:MAG: hypothetical protein AUI01_10535 [Ktedonobacter sp. 13_2_20CM_2_56_8]|nr:MAG: hypothetical protein AUI01_10535 [Ktedonobacter sp. 13_2_20CM_2_56_8]
MICYRVAIRGSHSAIWRWKSPLFNSLHGVLKQLWDAHRTNWMEVRRLEVELGEGGDHDQPYDGYLPLSSSQELD